LTKRVIQKPTSNEIGFWLHLVDDVGTKIRECNEYIYIPDLRPETIKV